MWVNQDSETGEPYDILVIEPGTSVQHYFEVKSTKVLFPHLFVVVFLILISFFQCSEKRMFEMSAREWLFSYEHRQRYHLVRVYGAGSAAPDVAFLDDPWILWRNGDIAMKIVI